MAWTVYNKYHARKESLDGHTFDSAREARRYQELKFLMKAGEISDLELQKKYVLIPRQMGADGKVAERECAYFADFVYRDKAGNCVVEDAKGVRTKEYVIKRKLMLHVHGIRITEI